MYYSYLSKGLAKILGVKKKTLLEALQHAKNEETDAYISYKRLKNKINATTRLELDKFFSQRYDFKSGRVVSEEEYKIYRQN